MPQSSNAQTRNYTPFATNYLLLLLQAIALMVVRGAAGARQLAQNNQAKDRLSCIKHYKIPLPKNITDVCEVTYKYDMQVRKWNMTYSGCDTLVCPTPAPTRAPRPTPPPTKRRTSVPTPEPSPGPTMRRTRRPAPPTPYPTAEITKKPTKAPHPTRRPTRRPTRMRVTKPPTPCVPASVVAEKELLNLEATLNDAGYKPNKAALRTSAYSFASSQAYQFGMAQRGAGFISYMLKGIEYACLATLVSERMIAFPATCMLDKNGHTNLDWYESFKFQIGYGDGSNVTDTLTASYLRGFYPENWQQNNVAIVALDTDLGNSVGWMNLTQSEVAENEVSSIRFVDRPGTTDAIIDTCSGMHNFAPDGQIFFSQRNTAKAKLFDYEFVGMSADESGNLVSADIVGALKAYAEKYTGESLYSVNNEQPLAGLVDKRLACTPKNKFM